MVGGKARLVAVVTVVGGNRSWRSLVTVVGDAVDFMIMGLRGAGKSLYGTAFACALSKKTGLPILSNIGINFPGAERLTSLKQFAEATGRICLLDEAHRNLDSRLWTNNKEFTDILLYNRKRMKHVIYTTPHVRNLDVRIRDIVPILIVVQRPRHSDRITASWFDVERAGGLDSLGDPMRVDVVRDRRVFFPLYSTWEEAPILPYELPVPARPPPPRDDRCRVEAGPHLPPRDSRTRLVGYRGGSEARRDSSPIALMVWGCLMP